MRGKERGEGGFCRKKKRQKSHKECKEVRKMKRMREKKKKKQVVTIGEKNEKAGTHLMAKIRVV